MKPQLCLIPRYRPLLGALIVMRLVAGLSGDEGLRPLELEFPAPITGDIAISEAPKTAQTLVKSLLLDQIPDEYVDDDDWGGTRRRWDGLKVRTDGLRIHTKRRWKEVNHGTWKKYSVSMVDPDESLQIHIAEFQRTAVGEFALVVRLSARLNVKARLQEWNNGLRLLSITAEGQADVDLELGCTVAIRLDPTKLPPGVVVDPSATHANLQLRQLKLNRISKADGPLVDELGDALEKVVRRKFADRNHQLVEKINRQIQKNQDKLQFSMSDFVKQKWLGIRPKKTPPEPSDASGDT